MSKTTSAPTPPVTARDHVLGPVDAPLTIVEYGDFECPACGQAFGHMQRARRQLGDRLRIVFRHFPLDRHPHAALAAEAAEAADAQGSFWEMHDMLFHHQNRLQQEDLVAYARRLDLDIERFTRELADQRHRHRVEQDLASAVANRVEATPGVFVGATLLPAGVYSSDVLVRELSG